MTASLDTLPPAQYIRLDLFPAQISTDLARTTRVIVTDAHYYVFVDSSSGPTALTSGPLDDFTGTNTSSAGYTVTDADTRETFTVQRASGCGCGSRLRGFRPFPGVPHQAATSLQL